MKLRRKMLCSKTFRFLILLAATSFCGCAANENAASSANLVVVSAPQSGTIRRVVIAENTDVQQNAVLLEIAVASTNQTANVNRQPPQITAPKPADSIAEAERNLERAAVEAQRVETLVRSNAAPQAQLDAARAEYQRAQQRLDQLRRSQNSPINSAASSNDSMQNNQKQSETVVAVRSPVAGSVRVISVRAGQTVKAGQPVTTISVVR